MSKIDIINLVAATFSIISVIGSLIILYINKTIKDQIINKKEIKDYAEFLTKSKNVFDNIRKFTTVKNRLQILSSDKFVEYLKNFYELIEDIEYKIMKNSNKTMKDNITKLKDDIQFYSNEPPRSKIRGILNVALV